MHMKSRLALAAAAQRATREARADGGDNGARLAAVCAEARKEALQRAEEIARLCSYAGVPARIPAFMAAGVPIAEVRKALGDAAAADTRGKSDPGAIKTGWRKAVSAVNARMGL